MIWLVTSMAFDRVGQLSTGCHGLGGLSMQQVVVAKLVLPL